MTTKKIGGFSAIGLTLIYLIGLVMNASMLDTSGISDPVELVRFMAQHESLMYLWITLLYVVFGIVLVFLSWVLHDKFKSHAPFMSRVTLSFGLIWAVLVIASGMLHNVGMGMAIDMLDRAPLEAGSFFRVINGVHVGLGGGNEIPGAIWTFMIAIMSIKYIKFNKFINIAGLVVGIAGLLTIIPSLFDYTVMVFALGQMVWWVGMGISMLKS